MNHEEEWKKMTRSIFHFDPLRAGRNAELCGPWFARISHQRVFGV